MSKFCELKKHHNTLENYFEQYIKEIQSFI